jgi:hypothetical protein
VNGGRGYYLIEGRWENTRNTPGEETFFVIDQIGGSIDNAKRTATSYFNSHVSSPDNRIEWVAGIARKKQCYYGRNPHITFRITG